MLRLAIILTLSLGAVAHAADRRESLLLANCPREAGEYVGRFRGRILLHEELLAALGPTRADAIRRSIEHQLKYLWGYFRNDASAHGALQVVLGAEAPRIEILSEQPTTYGRDLPMPYGETAERLKLEEGYTRRGVGRGRVGRDDPAVMIEYELQFPLAICGRGQAPPPSVRVPLPPDPWLAYWHVPKERFRPLRYHSDRAITNPCADDDFADLPHPYYYWYDWLPTRHGPDDDGRPFDCREWLKEGIDYRFHDIALERVRAATTDFSRLRAQLGEGAISASILIGVVDHKLTKLDPKPLLAGLGTSSDESLSARAAKMLGARTWEAGTRSFLDVLRELGGVAKIERHTTTVEDGFVRVEVIGKLTHSGRAIRARFFLGLTDIFGPVPPRHWRILRRALGEDQLVAYWGHSGIGENMKLSQIEQHLAVPHATIAEELRRSPLRLVAFISCYSYMYFGLDLLAAGAERADGGYFVFTGTETAKHEAGPLAVLDLVDLVLRPDNADGRVDRLPRLGPDELWMVKEVLGARDARPPDPGAAR